MKEFILVIAFLFFNHNSFASFGAQTGLWKYETEVAVNGKKVDIAGMMDSVLAQLPPEQKKQVMEAMKKSQSGNSAISVGSDFKPEVCLTADMIKNGKLTPEKDSNCTHKITQNTQTKLTGYYDCKDKMKGNYSIQLASATQFSGKMKNEDKVGNKIDVQFSAHRISDKCK